MLNQGADMKQANGLLCVLAVLLLLGCSNEPADLKAAPLGERSVLEELAQAYTAISDEQLTVSPTSLPGEDRKKFVELVFVKSGYSYRETLRQMATSGINNTNQLHVDMAELVLMPHRNPRYPMELMDVYSADELQDVAVIERQLNM